MTKTNVSREPLTHWIRILFSWYQRTLPLSL